MPLLFLLVLLPVLLVALTPFLRIQRYRVSTMRKPARKWIAMLAFFSTGLSAMFLLFGAAFTNIWVSDTFGDAALGLAIGSVAGLIGVLITRWEPTPRSFHYTQNRFLVLLITLVVAGRIAFGLYRSLMAARAGIGGAAAIGAFGVPYSLGAGGIVIGYTLVYNAGLLWHIRRWEHRPLRVMARDANGRGK